MTQPLFKTCIAFGMALAAVHAAPLSLSDALREAMTQGASSRIESEKKVKAREFENEKRGLLWPTVAAYATAGRAAQPVDLSQYGGQGYKNMSGNQYAYGVEASGPIYTFGKLSTAIEMAKLQNKAVNSQVKRGLQDIQSQVVDAYANTLLAEQQVLVLRRSRERALEIFALTERDFNAGKGMKSDVLLAKASIKSLEPQILGAERTALMARQNLNRLLGRPTQDASELDSNIVLDGLGATGIPDRAQAVDQARKNRPDLIALETSARVYEGTAKIFAANYYPTIVYQGKAGFVGSEPEQLTEWVHRNWSVGVALNWTLFDGWGSSAANRAVSAQWRSDARVFQFQSTELARAVEMGIDGALKDLVSADSSLSAAQEGRDAASEAVTFLRANYPGGMLRLSDVLSAEEALRNAEFAVLASRISRTRAQAQLQIALGNDLVSVPEE